jgi:hypothetical protein
LFHAERGKASVSSVLMTSLGNPHTSGNAGGHPFSSDAAL